LDKSI